MRLVVEMMSLMLFEVLFSSNIIASYYEECKFEADMLGIDYLGVLGEEMEVNDLEKVMMISPKKVLMDWSGGGICDEYLNRVIAIKVSNNIAMLLQKEKSVVVKKTFIANPVDGGMVGNMKWEIFLKPKDDVELVSARYLPDFDPAWKPGVMEIVFRVADRCTTELVYRSIQCEKAADKNSPKKCSVKVEREVQAGCVDNDGAKYEEVKKVIYIPSSYEPLGVLTLEGANGSLLNVAVPVDDVQVYSVKVNKAQKGIPGEIEMEVGFNDSCTESVELKFDKCFTYNGEPTLHCMMTVVRKLDPSCKIATLVNGVKKSIKLPEPAVITKLLTSGAHNSVDLTVIGKNKAYVFFFDFQSSSWKEK